MVKVLLLIIAVLLYAQPAVPFCGTDLGAATDPAIAQHQGPAMESAHDCCDDGPDEAAGDCAEMLACGAGFAGLIDAPFKAATASDFSSSPAWPDPAGRLAPSHSFPPFRPPIS